MRRKRRSGAGGGEIAEVPVSCGFPRVCGIWFTVAFRETITIAAIGTNERRGNPAMGAVEGIGLGSAEQVKSSALCPEQAKAPAARCVTGGQIGNVGDLGRRAAHLPRRRKERGRRRTRQDQISRGSFEAA